MVASASKKNSHKVYVIMQVKSIKHKFTFIDEVIVRYLSYILSFMVEATHLQEKEELHRQRYNLIIKTVNALLSTKTRVDIAKAIRENLGKIHSFECAEILFYNEEKNQLYTQFENLMFGGEENIHIISFPSSVGLSGEIINHPSIRIRDPNTLRIFNSEIDNIVSKKEIHSYLFAPVFNSLGKINAIIQLINKIDMNVTKEDISLFKVISKIYGLIVERVLEKDSLLNLVLELKIAVDVISKSIAENNASYKEGFYLPKLLSTLRIADMIMERIIHNKEIFLKEGFSKGYIEKKLNSENENH